MGRLRPLTPREYVATLDRPLVENYGTDRARVLPGLHVLRGRW
ncbi:MAG: hypothetical protein R3F20_13155 [Planctomycetota bacterium]